MSRTDSRFSTSWSNPGVILSRKYGFPREVIIAIRRRHNHPIQSPNAPNTNPSPLKDFPRMQTPWVGVGLCHIVTYIISINPSNKTNLIRHEPTHHLFMLHRLEKGFAQQVCTRDTAKSVDSIGLTIDINSIQNPIEHVKSAKICEKCLRMLHIVFVLSCTTLSLRHAHREIFGVPRAIVVANWGVIEHARSRHVQIGMHYLRAIVGCGCVGGMVDQGGRYGGTGST